MTSLREFKNAQERRSFIEKEKDISLVGIGNAFQDEEDIPNCENIIGAATLPMGLAGPITVDGSHAEGDFYLPLATTEGALVASVSRGCKAISSSGGAKAHVHKVGTTRGPVFYVGSIENNKKFYKWLQDNEEKLAQIANETESHLTYKKMKVAGTADHVFVNFYFDTDDAMGMNMVTFATKAIVSFVEEQTGFSCISLAGNYDIDKKPAWMNMINNRGFKVWAEATISNETLEKILKTDAQSVYDVWLSKCMMGSAMSGSIGFNAHFANIVAAFYIATGQDPAHVVEGSTGITTTRVMDNGDLYISVYMPAVLLGTVGGGTGLKTQKEAQSIIGVNKSDELAEVLGGAVLAGELSLLSALSNDTLAKAHKSLGRKE